MLGGRMERAYGDAHTPLGDFIAEGCFFLEVDGVPAEGDVGLARGVLVGASDVGGPVTHWLLVRAPHAGLVGADAGGVDVVTSTDVSWRRSWRHEGGVTYWAEVPAQYFVPGTARVAESCTAVGINISSYPGNTVWQIETCFDALFFAWTVPWPSTQYGRSGKGFSISPLSLQ